ncbi:MAG: hypothetical protein SRB1_00021 [Desulfobacteraceae bacterium Eth-SRB1]|nr:MAG: hypothetical protein SRB1_00021 [Desulfobacteraceae bacterium Eth-SRB1]
MIFQLSFLLFFTTERTEITEDLFIKFDKFDFSRSHMLLRGNAYLLSCSHTGA